MSTILIAGGATGIGLAAMGAFRRNGDNVLLADINHEAAEPGTTAGFRKRSVGFRDGEPVVEIEWWGVFRIDPEVDGFTEAVRLKIEGDSTIETEARGSFFGDPTFVTAAKALNIVTPLRSLPPGVYRPDQVPFSR